MKRRKFTSKVGKAPGNRLLPYHFQTALPMLLPDWAEKSFVLFCPVGEQWLLRYFGVFLYGHCCISHRTCERNFHFNLLQRAIEIREIISDVNKKDTTRFAGKNFVSTDQRYRKIVACLLAKDVRSTPLIHATSGQFCVSDCAPNKNVLDQTGIPRMFAFLTQHRLRSLCHVIRVDDGRIPKHVLYAELATGSRYAGRSVLLYKHISNKT